MSQTLVALTTLTDPITPDENADLVKDMELLGPSNLGPAQTRALNVLFLIYLLQDAGGADYRTDHAQLVQDATALTGGISRPDAYVFRAATDYNAAKTGVASLSTDLDTLLAAARDLAEYPSETLERMIALLRYRLAQ